jgi:hypothetical protein
MIFKPCADRELYWNFACAEANSSRYGGFYQQLPASLLDRIRRGKRDELSEEDWKMVKAAVIALRGPLTTQLVELGTDWHEGGLAIKKLNQVRLLNYSPFVQLAPSRDLGSFVTALDAGRDPPGDEGFGQNYRRFRQEYDIAKPVGRPILVAPALKGPYTEIEGLTRMCTLISKHRANETVPAEIPVLVGVCLQFDQWQWK